MTPSEAQLLRSFQSWLDAMGGEVEALARLLEAEEAPVALRRASAASLAYLLRSFELIPEGIEELGYLDDLFVFRVLCERAVKGDPEAASFDSSGTVARLAAEAELVADFLGEDYALLQAASSPEALTEGRSADQLLVDPQLCARALTEARTWIESYRAPELGGGGEELVKLSAFFRTRLHRASSRPEDSAPE